MFFEYLNKILLTIKVFSIVGYSYFINYLMYNDKDQAYIYCIDKLASMNILFVKFIQWFVSESMNDCVKKTLRKYADNVPYTNDDINYDLLNKLLENAEKQNKTLNINSKPINSGTLALVYEGTLDEIPIVIKQMRKNILKELVDAIDLMKFIGYISQYIYILELFRLNEIIELQEQSLLDQADFIIERKNIELFYEKLKDSKNIIIPKLYNDITDNCSNEIIVMERLYGKKVQELGDNELEKYQISYNTMYFETIVNNGLIHADLHLGNIFFMDDYKIGLIDLGYIININSNILKNLGLFNKFYFNRQIKKMTKHIISHMLDYNSSNTRSFDEQYQIILKEIKNLSENGILSGNNLSIFDLLDLNKSLKHIDAKLKKDYVSLILTLGPPAAISSILKRNVNNSKMLQNYQKDFTDFILSNAPKSLQSYD